MGHPEILLRDDYVEEALLELRPLAVVDTRKYLEKVPKDSPLVAAEGKQYREMFEQWVDFCDKAVAGHNAAERLAVERIASGNLPATQAYILVEDLLYPEEETGQKMEQVRSARRAFAKLAGQEVELQEGDASRAQNMVTLFEKRAISILLSLPLRKIYERGYPYPHRNS